MSVYEYSLEGLFPVLYSVGDRLDSCTSICPLYIYHRMPYKKNELGLSFVFGIIFNQ
jgi:hypothetical protein